MSKQTSAERQAAADADVKAALKSLTPKERKHLKKIIKELQR